MKTKEYILSIYKKNYKPSFLLAWLRFLTYDELKSIDMLEPYDAAVLAKQIKSNKDWDRQVIEYTKENILYGLCILMSKLSNAIFEKNWVMASIFANDIKNWLYILDDNELKIDSSLNSKKIISYYRNVGAKYKIDI